MRKKKIEAVQALRAIAFIGVVMSHCGFNDSTGAWGVSIFIVMSGFLSVYNHLDDTEFSTLIKDNIKFSFSKIQRLYPLHMLMTMAAVFPLVISWIRGLSKLTGEVLVKFVLNSLLLQSWIPNNRWYCSFNSVSWFLSTCLFLYFVFPYVLKHIQLYKKRLSAVYVIISVFLAQTFLAWVIREVNIEPISDNFQRWITYILPLYRVGDYVIGCNLGYLFLKKRKKTYGKIQGTIAETISVFFVVITNYIYSNKIGIGGEQWIRYNLLFLPITIVIVYLFALKSGIITKVLTNKLSVYVGNRSGYAFLIHLMVISYMDVFVWHFAHTSLSPIIKTLIVLLITLLLTEVYIRAINVLKLRCKI